MSFKKIFAVGMVMALVGMAAAQKGPVFDNNLAIDGENGTLNLTGKAEVNFNIEGRAILYVFQATPDGFAEGLDSAAALKTLIDGGTAGQGVMLGNVAHVLVQTNFKGWDVVVTSRFGGKLMKTAEKNPGATFDATDVDRYEELGAWSEPNMVPNPAACGPGALWNDPCQGQPALINVPINHPGLPGYKLRKLASGSLADVELNVAVSLMKAQAATLSTTATMVQKFTTLFGATYETTAGTPMRDYDNALKTEMLDLTHVDEMSSFAEALGGTAFTAGIDNPFSDVTGTGGAIDPATNGFDLISNGYDLTLDQIFPGQYYRVPPTATNGLPKDQTAIFAISANLLGTGETLSGNVNGVYSEELTFTFVAQY
ncbi:MAG: hypothetical protein FWC23_08145 [Chitinispirillia bacterium]|nr:hypothetical protein [Chitinispirillia bacterium]MCL2269143.1 hypothetical protein [Chitinispirillia bacterium]